MPQRIRILLLAVVALVVVANLSLILFTASEPAAPKVPNPNGYQNFIKASGVVSESVSGFRELDHDALRALVSENAEALGLLRQGLAQPCVLPLESVLANPGTRMSQLAGMKRLAQLLLAEGRLHEVEHQIGQAAQSYTDAIRFGNEASRGGMIIVRLVGIACEAMGCQALTSLVPQLGQADSIAVVRQLEKVDANRVSWAEVVRTETYYVRHLPAYRFNPVMWVVGWWQSRQAVEKTETRHKLVTARERLLTCELALRNCRSAEGHTPPALAGLVPKYLTRVPQDPFGGKPMVYRSEGTNWLVYSIGPDGVDDGGKAVWQAWPMKGDIRFDSL